MKSTILIVGVFILGTVLGVSDILPQEFTSGGFEEYALYALMFLVGMGIGCDRELKNIFKSFSPKILLIPTATIIGTLSFSALAAIFLKQWDVAECLAVGSGFGYYSLSSILITQLKEAELGIALATELGTIALIANIMREIMTLIGTPLLVKYFGKLAPICAGGATTEDTTFPIIMQYSGKDYMVFAIIHGILIDFTVPVFVSFFCSI